MVEEKVLVKLAPAPSGAGEVGLIDERGWAVVQGLWEQGFAKKAIARRLGVDVKTVRKWIGRSWKAQRRKSRSELDRFEVFLRGRAPEVGFNGVVLKREAEVLGYEGSYSALARYVSAWRRAWRGEDQPTVRFETGPGEQSQVDWGSTWVYLGEERVRVHIFTMVLGYSRRIFARAYLSEGLGSLLDAHERAFSHFGGRTEAILYDNPRTVVTEKDEARGTVVWNGAFKDRMDFYGVDVKLCRYYRAQTKGKVESGVKYVKRNGLAGHRFSDLEELNAYLLWWCLNIADQRIHGTTHEKPSERFARAEKLIAVDLRPAPPRERVLVRRVPKDAYVAVETNRYPVLFGWVGKEVEVTVTAEEIRVVCDGSQPLLHHRLEGSHRVARWEGPARSLPRGDGAEPTAPPRFDLAYLASIGEVSIRPLESYEKIASGVRS
jgi:transposase